MDHNFTVTKLIACTGIVGAFLICTAFYGPKVEEELERLKQEFPKSKAHGVYKEILYGRTLGSANQLLIGFNGCMIYYLNPDDRLDSLRMWYLGLEPAMNQLKVETMHQIHRSHFVNTKYGCYFSAGSEGFKMRIPDFDEILSKEPYYPFQISNGQKPLIKVGFFKSCN